MGKNIYIRVHELLCSGQKLVLVRTIQRSGSTPRDVGSMCIITEKQQLIGTIGGGLVEYQVQEQAAKLMKEEKSLIHHFTLTNEDLAKDGMICGGDIDLYLEPLSPSNPETCSVFQAIQEQITGNRPGVLVTRIQDKIHVMDKGARVFIAGDGKNFGSIPGFHPEKSILGTEDNFELIHLKDPEQTVFMETIGRDPRIFLFGAGHVSQFVAELAIMVGFSITVVDDRMQFANKERFPGADEILVSNYEKAFDQLKIWQNGYILIITRGHLHDKLVLEKALGTKAAYIGMIGSTRKRDIIYRDLMEKGFSKEDLKKVYSPVGLDIHAETPEEIAVSIVGELIQKRAPKKKNKSLFT